MSVAKRDRGKDPEQPEPANDDEGKAAEDDQQRFMRTNQALKWAKNSISDTKLYLYAKTGQIQESEDSADVIEACAKLDTFREQIESLLLNAENWTKSMLQTWDFQTSFVDSLHEGSSVILAFDRSTPPAQPQPQPPADNVEQKPADPSDASDQNQDRNENEDEQANSNQSVDLDLDLSSSVASSRHSQFAQILHGIAGELLLSQQASERRYGHANKLLVVPLRNILSHEIAHALGMKKRYVLIKRQFDNCCTTITNLQTKLHEMDHPPHEADDENEKRESGQGGHALIGKLKLSFGKLTGSAPTRDDVEAKLKEARDELPKYVKVFEESRQQLLEAIDIIDQKLNVEVVYYVQQFASFVKEHKHGDITPIENVAHNEQSNVVGVGRRTVSVEEKEAAAVLEAVLPAQEVDEAKEKAAKESEFVAEMRMDAMMSQVGMDNLDTVNLGSPEVVQEKQEQVNENEEDVQEVELGGNEDEEVMHGVET